MLGPPAAASAVGLLAVSAALTFYPLVKAYSLGQIQAWLNPLFATVMLAWMLGARGIAGAALGLMCLVKPTYGLLFVWGAVRQELRFVASGAVVIASGLALSLWRYGLHDHLEYLRVLSFIGRRGEAFYANQSINARPEPLAVQRRQPRMAVSRLRPRAPGRLRGHGRRIRRLRCRRALAPHARRRHRHRSSIAALATTLTAPLAWEHHYGILLPIWRGGHAVRDRPAPAGRLDRASRRRELPGGCELLSVHQPLRGHVAEPASVQASVGCGAGRLGIVLLRRAHARTDRATRPPVSELQTRRLSDRVRTTGT